MQKTCKQCGIEFSTEFPDKLYHDARCKREARDRRKGIQPLARSGWKPGDRFGRLVLVERLTDPNKTRQIWLCNCDCGVKGIERRADKLKSGRQQSCGCLGKEYRDTLQTRREKETQEQNEVLATLRQLKQNEQEEAKRLQFTKSVVNKHQSLRMYLSVVYIHKTDPLWNPRYYAAVIEDGCHYCRGPLEKDGMSLVEIDPDGPLTCWNVVPACNACRDRRALYFSKLSHIEMEWLGKTLELIRLRREAQ